MRARLRGHNQRWHFGASKEEVAAFSPSPPPFSLHFKCVKANEWAIRWFQSIAWVQGISSSKSLAWGRTITPFHSQQFHLDAIAGIDTKWKQPKTRIYVSPNARTPYFPIIGLTSTPVADRRRCRCLFRCVFTVHTHRVVHTKYFAFPRTSFCFVTFLFRLILFCSLLRDVVWMSRAPNRVRSSWMNWIWNFCLENLENGKHGP